MDENRFVLSNRVWERLAPLLPGKATDSGSTGSDNHLFLEAVFWCVIPTAGNIDPYDGPNSLTGLRCVSRMIPPVIGQAAQRS